MLDLPFQNMLICDDWESVHKILVLLISVYSENIIPDSFELQVSLVKFHGVLQPGSGKGNGDRSLLPSDTVEEWVE